MSTNEYQSRESVRGSRRGKTGLTDQVRAGEDGKDVEDDVGAHEPDIAPAVAERHAKSCEELVAAGVLQKERRDGSAPRD